MEMREWALRALIRSLGSRKPLSSIKECDRQFSIVFTASSLLKFLFFASRIFLFFCIGGKFKMSLCSCDVLLRREALSLSAVVVVRAVGTLLLDVVV